MLLIKNGTVVNASGEERRCDVLCGDNGTIVRMDDNIDIASVAVVATDCDPGTDRAELAAATNTCDFFDAAGMLVMPGGIDPHTHLNMPFMGTVTCDDFDSGTAAALAGGTTSIIDFIIPRKQTSLLQAYEKWHGWARDHARCNYGFHCAITWWNEHDDASTASATTTAKEDEACVTGNDPPRVTSDSDVTTAKEEEASITGNDPPRVMNSDETAPLPDVAAEMEVLVNTHGINSFKHFMAYKNVLLLEDYGLCRSFAVCRRLGVLAAVHAENGEMIDYNITRMKQQRKRDDGSSSSSSSSSSSNSDDVLVGTDMSVVAGHARTRTTVVEGEAAERACMIAAATNVDVPLMVVHTSAVEAIDAVERSRRAGNRVLMEATIAHLMLDVTRYAHDDKDVDGKDGDIDACWKRAAMHVLSPPLRPRTHVDALWAALARDSVTYVCTDHCSFDTRQRSVGRRDFTLIPNGVASIEERLVLLWTAGVVAGRITRSQFVALTSTRAAQTYNLYPAKGVVAVGSDADLVVFDPNAAHTIRQRTQHHRSDVNVYEGVQCTGRVAATVLGGRIVYTYDHDDAPLADGQRTAVTGTHGGRGVTAAPGSGTYLRRRPFAPFVYREDRTAAAAAVVAAAAGNVNVKADM